MVVILKIIPIKSDLLAGFSSPFPFPFDDLAGKLEKKGYKIPKNQMTIAIGPEGQQIELQKMKKENLELVYNQFAGHFTITSDEIENLLDAMKEVLEVIESDDLPNPSISFYELNHHTRVLAEKHPMDKTKMKNEDGLEYLDEITGLKTQPYSKVVCAFGDELPEIPLNKIPTWLHLSVHPFIPNPLYFYVHIVYRRKSIDKIEVMIGELDSVIKRAITDM